MSVIESERTPQSDKGHILRQTARTEFPQRKYDSVMWVMILLYIPFTIGPLMLAFGHVLPFTLLVCAVVTVGMGVYNKLETEKRNATKGNFYIDNRASTGRMEVVEQVEVRKLSCVVRPGKPYPYHKVRVQKEEYESLLSKVGTEAKIYDADTIQGMIDAGIEEDVERRLRTRLAEPPTFKRWFKSALDRKMISMRLRKKGPTEQIHKSIATPLPAALSPIGGVVGAYHSEEEISWELDEEAESTAPMDAEEAAKLKKRTYMREYMRKKRAREKTEKDKPVEEEE